MHSTDKHMVQRVTWNAEQGRPLSFLTNVKITTY